MLENWENVFKSVLNPWWRILIVVFFLTNSSKPKRNQLELYNSFDFFPPEK